MGEREVVIQRERVDEGEMVCEKKGEGVGVRQCENEVRGWVRERGRWCVRVSEGV